ncbi:MAG: hypothetical protein M1834_001286 [Cirrosporium novae-zelandiae]|nr:MAG: hypothetical protein M1834_001286 [Cirrosporium novae-zelandiae]
MQSVPPGNYIGPNISKVLSALGTLIGYIGIEIAPHGTLDKFFGDDLFKGDKLEHMLGTACFHDTKIKYTVHEGDEFQEVRNGLWVRTINGMPMEYK